jgi:hypothetical protein
LPLESVARSGAWGVARGVSRFIEGYLEVWVRRTAFTETLNRSFTHVSKFCEPLHLKQSDYLLEGAFSQYFKAEDLRYLVLMKRSGWDEPAEVLPRRRRWGHGGVDVFAFSHRIALGPTTHVLEDVEWGSDAASIGGGSFAEAMRCPFEAYWWGGFDGGVSFVEPCEKCCIRFPVSCILVRCDGQYCGWWGVAIEFFAVGDALRAIQVQ